MGEAIFRQSNLTSRWLLYTRSPTVLGYGCSASGGAAPAEVSMLVLIHLLRRSPLLWYFALAYAASGLALAVIGWPRLDATGDRPAASLAIFPVVVIGAGLAGLAMTAATGGREGLRQLRARLMRWRLGRWWLVLLLPPLGILAVLTA